MEENIGIGLFELIWVTWYIENEDIVCFAIIYDPLYLLELGQGEDVCNPG